MGLKRELVNSYRYAFRNKAELIKELNKIAKQHKHTDLVFDIGLLGKMGEANSELLKTIGFDTQKIKLAQLLSNQSQDILADLNKFKKSGKETKIYRDKAYTYLKQLMDELKEGGKYIFRHNPERLKGYKSEYINRKNLHARKKDTRANEN